MNIVIVGGGVVGTATGLGLQRLGHGVNVLDPKPDCRAASQGLHIVDRNFQTEYSALYWSLIKAAHCILICTPEDSVEHVMDSVGAWPTSSEIPVYIRSSVPPGTCRRLQEKWRRHIGHNPDFLRESVAEYEFLNPPGIILGDCCPEHGARMEELYRPFRVPIHHTDPTTSELTKLAINGHLACLISYWNQVKLLAEQLGVNSHQVGMLAAYCDDRVSVYGSRMHGRYGGRCLPKDLEQLITLCQEKHVYAPLFQAVKAINDFGSAL